MDIEKLLSQPESKTLEFKQDLSSLPPILKTTVAFANTAGGTLIIGRAKDGTLVGLPDVLTAEEKLANAIADNIYPPILPEVEIATIKGKNILVLRVSYWRGPFYIKRQGMPNGVYVRLGSTSRPAGPESIAEMQRTIRNISFDQEAIPDLSPESLNLDQMNQMFQHNGKAVDHQKLKSMGILVTSGNRIVPSVGGLILFGQKEDREQWIPDARVGCARFLGETKANILDRYEVEGTILDAVNEVPKFIARNTRLSAKIETMRRQDIPEYPSVAVREALVNAFARTDYSLSGSYIQIAIFDDRLEIQNPGMLPFGYTMDDLKSGVSRIRNRVIARVFRELNLIEEWGSGYKRIVEACQKEGYPIPLWEELGSVMRVTFYPHPLTQPTQKSKRQKPPHLTERQAFILEVFTKDKAFPFREIHQKCEEISERTLRYELLQLKKLGLLDRRGRGRATVWYRL